MTVQEKETLEQVPNQLLTRFGSLAIAVTGFAVYANSFQGVLLFDDAAHIVQNERIKHLNALGTVLSGTRPIVDLSLAVNYSLHQLRVPGYHAANVTIHILAALALFGIVRRTLLMRRNAEGIRNYERNAHRAGWPALIVALIWLVHPLQTQSVTYVIQRAESMMGLFYLLTIYCVIRGASGRIERTSAGRWHLVAVACSALGMGCKAVMVTAPLVVLLYDWIFLSRGSMTTLRRRWPLYVGLVASWTVLWAVGIVKGVLSTTNPGAHLGFGYHEITPVEYALTQFGVIIHYVQLAIWPGPLCLDHSWPLATAMTSILPPAVLVAVMLAVSLRGTLRRSWLGFMGGCFFLILAPTSSIVPIKDTLFEHRMYLPLAVVVALAVVCVHRLLELLAGGFSWPRQVQRLIGAILVIGLLATLSVGTIRRNRDYRSLIAMWTDVTNKIPRNARALEHLGTANMMRGRPTEAIADYTQAVELDENYASAHCNLANVLLESGRAVEAEEHYRQVLRIDPHHVEAGMNLGQSLTAQGRIDEAIEQFRATTLIKPTRRNATLLARTFVNYGSAIGNRGDFDGAIAAYRESVRLWPEYDHGHYWLGILLIQLGETQEAIQHFRRTLEINPQHVRAQQALDNALRR